MNINIIFEEANNGYKRARLEAVSGQNILVIRIEPSSQYGANSDRFEYRGVTISCPPMINASLRATEVYGEAVQRAVRVAAQLEQENQQRAWTGGRQRQHHPVSD